MDPTGGVNPTAPIPADYMQSMGYAGTTQAPPSFMQPVNPVSPLPQSVDTNMVSTPQTYSSASPTQDQFYPRPPSTDNRPDWQQQIVAEVNAAQTYNPNLAQMPAPEVEVLSSSPMQISRIPSMIGVRGRKPETVWSHCGIKNA